MKIGDTVKCRPVTFYDQLVGKTPRQMTGRVVYIHPRERYHVVAFPVGGGVIRESFRGVQA